MPEQHTAPARNLFGNYEILETIGHGGMGIVYRAMDLALDRAVALKVLREDLRSQTHLVARFQREGEAFATLNHPNIVHIYAVGKVGRIPYLAMEYIEGTPLSKLMKRERRVPWERALDYGEQVARALACAHDCHIIHRDIKPGNILVDKDGHAYVTDLGIAKVLTAETQLTVDGSRLGTPQYMSPERCLNREVTASSDIYSLGVVLFQMISGRLPHEGATPVQLIEHIISQPPSRLSQYTPDVPENVERLVAYMTERKPEDRPTDAHRLVEAIIRVRAGKPLHVGGDRSQALASLREDFATPTPYYREKTGAGLQHIARLVQRTRTAWAATPRWLRYTTALLGIGLFAMGISSTIVGNMTEGMAFNAVREATRSQSQWAQSGAVASFTDESDGVTIAQFYLQDYQFSQAVWNGSGDAVALEFISGPQPPLGRAAALCIAEPGMRRASIAVPPFAAPPGLRKPALSLLAASGAANTPVLFLTRTGAGSAAGGTHTRIYRAPWQPPGAAPQLVLDLSAPQATFLDRPLDMSAALTAAASPDGSTVAVAMASHGDQWRVYETRVPPSDSEVRWQSITGWGGAVNAMYYAPSGERLALLRASEGGGDQLIVVQRASGSENVIDTGQIALSAGCFSPSDQQITYAKRESDGTNAIWRASLGGAPSETLGEGSAVAWHPSGRYLVAVAADRVGRNQLWRVEVNQPAVRQQLTFLESGTGDSCHLSPSGNWALAAKAEAFAPAVVLVDLARLVPAPPEAVIEEVVEPVEEGPAAVLLEEAFEEIENP
jgi:predicted Ser/Thr protein kinase